MKCITALSKAKCRKQKMHVYRITQALNDFDYQITKKEAEAFQHAYEQNQRKIELTSGIKEILTWAKKERNHDGNHYKRTKRTSTT